MYVPTNGHLKMRNAKNKGKNDVDRLNLKSVHLVERNSERQLVTDLQYGKTFFENGQIHIRGTSLLKNY